MMTLQEIFNKIWERSKTKKQAFGDGGCMYKDPSGNCCFVGCLINPELYDTNFEGWSFEIGRITKALYDSGVSLSETRTLNFLQSCRRTHDKLSPEKWEEELRELATDYGLAVPD